MTTFRGQHNAFGHPGIEPRWTHGSKDGVGTAYSASSSVWFTLWNGVLTEVYYPAIDRPQIRDLQYLVSDGESFFHEEKRHFHSETKRLWTHALGYRITNTAPDGQYQIIKDVISEPHLPCILQHTMLKADAELLPQLQLYVLWAPHLELGGWGNNAHIVKVGDRSLLAAEKNGVWAVSGATVPFQQLSCGYVGNSDGWTDLADNFQMDWEFDCALDGNVALTGAMDLTETPEFTLGLAFGYSLHQAITTLFQSLDIPFEHHQQRYIKQWKRPQSDLLPLEKVSTDEGNLYYGSVSLLLAHEDKIYQGALIASLSIPWGQTKGDCHTRGYHMVWVRDMVNSAMALLAAGITETPLRTLIYLAATQEPDGGFAQSVWLNGDPYQTGVQLDQVALPILLAWHLWQAGALRQFDPYPMVVRAAGYLIRYGPVTEQERWEQSSGYSPATLATNIAALIAAAAMMRDRGDEATAQFAEDYADFLECHIEAWTVTTEGTLVPEIPRHYIRIHPAEVSDPRPDENPNTGTLYIPHRNPDTPQCFPAKEIVDASFLELVRYGIRSPNDPIIKDSLRVVDEVLKVETPYGPCWRRYNHDGHGQRQDGSAWEGWGQGRAWTLLTGERGHYELLENGNVTPYIEAMEGFASATGLLPEQIWDAEDLPEVHMHLGRPTGSAMPLMWSHAEYIKLLRSTLDGQTFDQISEVSERYLGDRHNCHSFENWKPNRQVQTIKPGYILRIQAHTSFRLRWSCDGWETVNDTEGTCTPLDIAFVDIPTQPEQTGTVQFTFFWTETENWEGQNYEVKIQSPD